MTIRYEPDLWCDRNGPRCVGWFEHGLVDANARSLRQAARKRGWTKDGSADVCPACLECPPEPSPQED